jgi:cell division protein FtsL
MISPRLIAAGVVIAAVISVYFYGRYEAMKACDNRHKVAELEQTIERKKKYEKIDKKLPYSSSRDDRFIWLLSNTYQ